MTSNKRLSKRKKNQIQRDSNHLVNNKFVMKRITPLNKNQDHMFKRYEEYDDDILAIGSAGTGKTYLSLYLGLKDVMENQERNRVVIVRSAVQSREQGFMPGSLSEKMSYFEQPYIDIVNDLFEDSQAYGSLKQKKTIEFMSTSFIRGLTIDNAVIILDEAQNCTYQELDSVMTRIGENTKIIICGDTRQDDLKISKNKRDVSGLSSLIHVCKDMPSFSIIHYSIDDIVRSGTVRDYIISKERILEAA